MKPGLRHLLRHSTLPSLVGAVACLGLLGLLDLGGPIDLSLRASYFRLRATLTSSDPGPVTVVVLRGDAEGFQRRGRDDLVAALEALALLPSERRPAAVVVDVGLLSPPTDTLTAEGPTPTQRLLDAQHALGTVVQPYSFYFTDGFPGEPDLSPGFLERHRLPFSPIGGPQPLHIQGAYLSIREALYRGAAAAGFVNLSPAERRGSPGLHALPLLVEAGPIGSGALYPSLALAGAAVVRCGSEAPLRCIRITRGELELGGPQGSVRMSPRELPINYRPRYLLNRGPKPQGGAVDLLFFVPASAGGVWLTRDEAPLGGANFAGRAVVLVDRLERAEVPNPMGEDLLPGAVHAQALANLLESDLLHVVSPSVGPWLGLILVVLGILSRALPRIPSVRPRARLLGPWGPAALYLRNALLSVEVLLVLSLYCLGAAMLIFKSLTFPIAAPIAALFGSLAGRRVWLPRQLHQDALTTAQLLDARRSQITEISLIREELEKRLEDQSELRDELRATAADALAGLNSILKLGGGVPISALPEPRLYQALGLQAPDASGLAHAANQAARCISELRSIARKLEQTTPHRAEMTLLRTQRATYEALIGHYSHLLQKAEAAIRPLGTLMREEGEGRVDSDPVQVSPDMGGLVFADPRLAEQILRKVRMAANAGMTVMLRGETGCGKSALAELIHCRMKEERGRKGAFVEINCAGIPELLLESELFGTVKGAFTDAIDRAGLFEQANRGTLFLDEIGEMSLLMQAKLLRAVETGRIRRVGAMSGPETAVDVNIICATHRNLEAMMSAGEFREDLYHRLGGVCIELPPLRERVSEFSVLVDHFLNAHWGHRVPSITPISAPVLLALKRWSWPGNIRELNSFLKLLAATVADRLDHEGGVTEVTLVDLEATRSASGPRDSEGIHPRTPEVQPPPAAAGEEESIFGVKGARVLAICREAGFEWSQQKNPKPIPKSTFHLYLWRFPIHALLASRGDVAAAARIMGGSTLSTPVQLKLEKDIRNKLDEMIAAAEAGGAMNGGRTVLRDCAPLKDWLERKMDDQTTEEVAYRLLEMLWKKTSK